MGETDGRSNSVFGEAGTFGVAAFFAVLVGVFALDARFLGVTTMLGVSILNTLRSGTSKASGM
jgi:hypothetical protein